VCVLRPADLAKDLPSLRIGKAAVGWYQDEIERVRSVGPDRREDWAAFEAEFLGRAEAAAPAR
jgi:hypothetical protein